MSTLEILHEPNYSIETQIHELIHYPNYPAYQIDFRQLLQSFDALIIDSLIINHDISNMSSAEKEVVYNKIGNLVLNIGDQHVLYLPISFLANLNNPLIQNGSFELKTSLDIFFDRLIYSPFQRWEMRLESETFCHWKIAVKIRGICYENDYRKKLIQENITCYSDMSSLYTIQFSPTFNLYNKLCFNGQTRGIYLIGDVSSITSIKLEGDGVIYKNYDYNAIEQYCHKINENILFVPIKPGEKYNNMSANKWDECINLNIINEFYINLTFSKPISEMSFISESKNILKRTPETFLIKQFSN